MTRTKVEINYLLGLDEDGDMPEEDVSTMFNRIIFGTGQPSTAVVARSLISTTSSHSAMATHTYYKLGLHNHPVWKQHLTVFDPRDTTNGANFHSKYGTSDEGEAAYGIALVPFSLSDDVTVVAHKFFLKGGRSDDDSPFMRSVRMHDRPFMAVFGRNFISACTTGTIMFGRPGPPGERGLIVELESGLNDFCSFCLAKGSTPERRRCGGSCGGRARYCVGTSCQKDDWRYGHKAQCTKHPSGGELVPNATYPW